MTREQVINIFQYLKDNQMSNYRPVTRLEDFDYTISEQNIIDLIWENNEDIVYNKDGILLKVKNVGMPERPSIPAALQDWIQYNKEYDLIIKEYIIQKVKKPVTHSKRLKALFQEYKKSGDSYKVPDELQGYISFNNKKPELIKFQEIENTMYLRDYHDVHQAVNDFQSYYRTWQKVYRRNSQIKKLHTDLYSKYQRLLIESDKYELLWCIGLLKWHHINRHMVVQCLDIVFDAATADIFVTIRDAAPKYEDDMLNEIDQENRETYYRFRSDLVSLLPNIDLTRYEFCEEYMKNTVHYLDINGSVQQNEADNKKPEHPLLCYSPYLVFRERSATLWVEEFDRVIGHLEQTSTLIPEPLNILVNPDLIDINEENSSTEDLSYTQELFFPLPTNAEQRDIANRLFNAAGVVVQGPPGTGKSHAIANLICYLLAHGKRVLISSQKAHPLKVIKEKLPVNIRSLAVFIGDNSVSSYEETRKSVEYIANVISNLNIDSLNKEIATNRSELDNLAEKIAQTEDFFKIANELDNQTVVLFGEEYNSVKAAKWVHENIHLQGIEDHIDIEQEIPLSLKEYQELVSLLTNLSYSDYSRLSMDIPRLEDIPIYQDFETYAVQYRKIDESTSRAKTFLEDFNVYDETLKAANLNKDELQGVLDKIDQLLRVLDTKGIYDRLIPELSQEEEYFSEKLKEILQTYEGIKTTIMNNERQLMTDSVRINSQISTQQMLDDVDELLSKGVIPNTFFKKLLYSNRKYVFEDILVNNKRIDTIENLRIAQAYLITQASYEKVGAIWRSFLDFYNIDYDIDGKTLPELNQIIKWFQALLNIKQYLEEIRQWVSRFGSEKLLSCVCLNYDELCQVNTGINAIRGRLHCLKAEEYFDTLINMLTAKLQHQNSSDYWRVLKKAAADKDHGLWNETIKELKRIWSLKGTYDRITILMNKLSNGLPIYASKLLVSHRKQEVALDNHYLDRFKWKKLNDWLAKIDELLLQSPEKQAYLENLRQKENSLMVELIESLACKHLNENVSGRERASLLAWLDYIRRGGKGTTERTKNYLKLAQQEIKNCVSAIPVFIMPVTKVIENIDVRERKVFDVLIVDESSQCDLRSLSLLMRAKKIVIVGDDRQISPTRVSAADREADLIDKHLYNVPHRHTFDMRNSLYDKAKFMFKKHIMLKEHFRCVPEIIQFSNDLMYDGQIVPLRVPKTRERIVPPVKAIFLDKGYRKGNTNPPEAKAIVDMVTRYCSDSTYDGKSMGIISLQGDEQASLINEYLYQALSKTEIEKRQLIAGDAYHFQGDERDVIFMSMVVATEGDKRITALTQATNLQRYNVAASRARDEMVLFYSVRLSDFQNPNCVRHKLLSYCLNPHRVMNEYDQVKHKFDSPFEEEVFKLLAARGYYTRVQVPAGVGKKRIDLVVEGLTNRLAIECDGDAFHPPEQYEEDFERQRILERVGWTFYRIRGSQFYRHREKALDPLWKKLDEMGIEPYIEPELSIKSIQ